MSIYRVKYQATDNLWIIGTIEPGSFTFRAKIYDLPSSFGIEGGTISKLEVRSMSGEIVVRFDRGWDIPPINDESWGIVKALVETFPPGSLPTA